MIVEMPTYKLKLDMRARFGDFPYEIDSGAPPVGHENLGPLIYPSMIRTGFS
jgi:hypothetical protein